MNVITMAGAYSQIGDKIYDEIAYEIYRTYSTSNIRLDDIYLNITNNEERYDIFADLHHGFVFFAPLYNTK